MAGERIRSQAVIPYVSGLSEDIITNTMHWLNGVGDLEDGADYIAARLIDFYDGVYLAAGTADTYVNWAGAIVRVFDMDVPGSSPVERQIPITPVSPASGVLPSECSAVLSYHGAIPVTPRRRNRIYLGGFANAASFEGTGANPPRLAGTLRTNVIAAAQAMHADNDVAEVQWMGWSGADGTMFALAGGWIDDAWDTQRRRGTDASVRNIFTF